MAPILLFPVSACEPEHDVKFEQKIGEIFKLIPEDEVYDELPPWPRVTNETMYMLCPKCMCLFKCWVEEDKSMYYKKDVGYPCDFLKPVIAAAPKHF
jgi:hypothetical protein